MNGRRKGLIVIIMLTVALLVLSACGQGKPVEQQSGEKTASAALPPAPPIEKVKPLIQKGGCASCHTIPGIEGATAQVGPSFCDPAEEVQSGEEDIEFIRESILEPDKEIAKGFSAGIMPKNFGDIFTDEEIDTLVAFIANLKCE